jgi:hypothetical protein
MARKTIIKMPLPNNPTSRPINPPVTAPTPLLEVTRSPIEMPKVKQIKMAIAW